MKAGLPVEARIVWTLSLRTRFALWVWTRGWIRLGQFLMPPAGECHTYRLVVTTLAAVVLVAMGTGCAVHHAAAGPAKVYAQLDQFPLVQIAYRPITLTARLIDPAGVVLCPRVTWTYPDGTRSSHLSDCDPDDHQSGHIDVKRGALPPGDHRFEVEFDSEGRRWRAERTVSVP